MNHTERAMQAALDPAEFLSSAPRLLDPVRRAEIEEADRKAYSRGLFSYDPRVVDRHELLRHIRHLEQEAATQEGNQ